MFRPCPSRAMEPTPPRELQQSLVLARLRSYGPAFDHELIAECLAPDPGAVVAELNAQGYHIETLQTFRPLPTGCMGWAQLYVLRVKCATTGQVVAAPLPVGFDRVVERWAT